jgi:dimethylargininase
MRLDDLVGEPFIGRDQYAVAIRHGGDSVREDGAMPIALVRPPGPRLADGIVTHIKREPVDVDRAIQQWHGYVAALDAAGWDVVHVDAAPDHPDAVFIEDTVVMYGELAVITRPGAAERRAEVTAVESVLRSLGYEIAHITAPATLDGGDVLKIGDSVYVGLGGRTSVDGIEALRDLLAPRGATVVAVPVSKALHLKSAVTALPDGTVIGYEPVVDDPSVFGSFLAVPEEPGSHVVLLGDDRLLMAADAPRSAELFRSLGYSPITVEVGEFAKLEGCVTCLSVRLRDAPTLGTPPEA